MAEPKNSGGPGRHLEPFSHVFRRGLYLNAEGLRRLPTGVRDVCRNTVPIPAPFIPYFRDHKKQQTAQQAAAGKEWRACDAVFTRPDGRPIDPRADWEEFKELLEEAGISDRRLYDGSRHTTNTILNELGVDMPTIMEILRHTQISQTRRCGKGRSALSRDAMLRMGNAFTPGPSMDPSETRSETPGSRTGRSRRRRRIR